MLLSSAVATKIEAMSFFCGSLGTLVTVCLWESDDVPSVLAQCVRQLLRSSALIQNADIPGPNDNVFCWYFDMRRLQFLLSENSQCWCCWWYSLGIWNIYLSVRSGYDDKYRSRRYRFVERQKRHRIDAVPQVGDKLQVNWSHAMKTLIILCERLPVKKHSFIHSSRP